MSEDRQIARLISETLVMERVADSICSAALVYRAKDATRAEQSLWRMARNHRSQALLARGKAAALHGQVIRVPAPE